MTTWSADLPPSHLVRHKGRPKTGGHPNLSWSSNLLRHSGNYPPSSPNRHRLPSGNHPSSRSPSPGFLDRHRQYNHYLSQTFFPHLRQTKTPSSPRLSPPQTKNRLISGPKRKPKPPPSGPIFSRRSSPRYAQSINSHAKTSSSRSQGRTRGSGFGCARCLSGAGYDSGRAKRARQDVNPKFRCDFFLWDSANNRKEEPAPKRAKHDDT